LEPLGWVVNDVQEDYGIDSNIQVFDGKSPNGTWFHVQLKSSETPSYSADGTFVSQALDIDHARHFALELRQPVFLVIVDVTAIQVFWHCPQLDIQLSRQLGNNPQAKSITVRIPTAQRLPTTAPDLLTSLQQTYVVLANRELVSSSLVSFAESLRHLPDQERLNREFQKKNDTLKLLRVARLHGEDKFDEARTRAQSIFDDPDSSVETKFWALIQLRGINYSATVLSGSPQSELSQVSLAHALLICKLTSSGPKYLKFYGLVVKKAAELEVLAYENSSLYMVQKAHIQRGGDPMIALGVYSRRSVLAKSITSKYNQCVRLARYASNYPDRWVLGRALPEIVNALARYLATLRFEDNAETEVAFARSALQINKLAAWISKETYDETGIAMAVLSALTIICGKNTEAYIWAQETAQAIADPEIRQESLHGIERMVQRWNGLDVEGDYVGDTVWQILQNISAGLGIDISDENAPLVRALRIAARDDSPERVLADCEHLTVSFGAIGPLARRVSALFNIRTAASKVVHCMLHSYHVEGKELDIAYHSFKQTHCDKCPDCKERPAGWTFDGKPTKRVAEFLTTLIGTAYDVRWTEED
jgi:hypothetical protein